MMLVVDNNNVKLLRMKEKILEVSSVNREQNLADYKKLAMDVDKEVYDAFVARIKNTNYHNLPFNEQLEFLLDIEQEYNNINELQFGFKNVYYRYAADEIELSNLKNILIDNVREKINNIQGFLINSEKLEANKADLEKLNTQLVTLEKQKIELQNKFLSMEKDLRYDFVNGEGRKIVDGISSYTSTISEYNDNAYDLRNLINNRSELEEKLHKALDERNSLEEELMAARICYKRLPNEENKEIYDNINTDMLKAGYHLTLLQMADLISDEKTTFEGMIQKREYLKAFNDLRLDCLSKLGIKFLIDPFSRTKVDSQLTVIKGYEDVNEKVVVARKKIANLSTVIDNRMGSNSDFIIELNSKDEFIKDNLSFTEVKEENITPQEINESFRNEAYLEDTTSDSKPADNLVVSVEELADDFAYSRAMEKTNSVIKRVSKLVAGKVNNNTFVKAAPNLLIQESLPEVNYYKDNVDLVEPEEDYDVKVDSVFVDEPVNNNEGNSNDLFEEVTPFEATPLFKEKFDESIFTSFDDLDSRHDNDIFVYNKIDSNAVFADTTPKAVVNESANVAKTVEVNNAAMPDMFWVTKENKTASDNNGELTFDEQIDKLMSSEEISRRKR